MEFNGLKGSAFLIPSKRKRYLDILERIRGNSAISQHGISKEMKVSSAIVNKYLSDLIRTRCVLSKKVSARRRDYDLTEKGEELYRKLTLEFHAELVRNYTDIKNTIMRNIRGELEARTRIGIFGASETGWLVRSIVDTFGKQIVCAFDNDEKKQGTTFYGLKVYAPDAIGRMSPDAIIITSIGSQEEIYSQLLRELDGQRVRIIRTVP